MEFEQIPIGLGMGLAMQPTAMERFAAMSEAERETFVARTRQVQSKEEMQQLIDSLTT